jgi:hypothetical protein
MSEFYLLCCSPESRNSGSEYSGSIQWVYVLIAFSLALFARSCGLVLRKPRWQALTLCDLPALPTALVLFGPHAVTQDAAENPIFHSIYVYGHSGARLCFVDVCYPNERWHLWSPKMWLVLVTALYYGGPIVSLTYKSTTYKIQSLHCHLH